jgi:transposase InsO family protein
MYPITHRHPFELLTADYLSLPKGKGGFHNVLLILDTYSQYTWGFKLKVHGTAKTTIDGLKSIAHNFRAPETFMTDGGSHFDNGDVRAWCAAHGTNPHVVAAYSPWINGLVENANGKLLGRLKRLCSPNLGEDEYEDVRAEDISRAWPDHFDEAVRHLNERIIPAFQFSPKELLLGLVVNTTRTPVSNANETPSITDVEVHMAYVDQQRLDGADQAVAHGNRRKRAFDRRVLKSTAGEVVFAPGQLVQVYANALEMTLASSRKLQPRWSAPRRITSRVGNSYTISTLEGFPISGLFHARRLRRFIPRDGTALASLQETLMETIAEEDIPSAGGHETDVETEESGVESEQEEDENG